MIPDADNLLLEPRQWDVNCQVPVTFWARLCSLSKAVRVACTSQCFSWNIRNTTHRVTPLRLTWLAERSLEANAADVLTVTWILRGAYLRS